MPRDARRFLIGALLCTVACGQAGPPVTALYDLSRASHFFAAPFPSDLLRNAQGTLDLPGFPLGEGLGVPIVAGYVRRFGTSVYGFGTNGAIYQKFSGPLDPGLLEPLSRFAPTPRDPVLLVPLGGGAADLVPLTVRFHDSALGDPYLTENLLTVLPRAGHPLRGNTTHAMVVLDSLRARGGGEVQRDPRFETLWAGRDATAAAALKLDALKATLASLGIASARVVSATVFTTQDIDGQLLAIRSRAEAALSSEHLELRSFKEVARISYAPGRTAEHQKPAALLTVTYTDGTTEVTEMDPETLYPPPLQIDVPGYPYRVFEGRLRTVSLQGVADKPFGTPGLGIINDAALDTGQIRFSRAADGTWTVTSSPEPEEMRVTIALPVDSERRPLTGRPVIVYDHGTGGSAYNMVQSPDGENRSAELTTLWGRHGAILVSRDQPLFGQRYPVVDRGFNIFLVAYNISNVTAFRDNLRQSAVDNLVLQRFVREKMNDLFVARGIAPGPVSDGERYFRFGHSLGSVTTHLGTALLPGTYQASLVSGSGGIFSLFLLDSGLLPRLAGDPENLGIILQALNIDPGAPLTAQELVGGLAGIPRGPGRTAIDRAHPVFTLFQTIMDPADPINHARQLALPITFIRGTGDLQVPNSAQDALAGAVPNATVKRCEPTSSYDPHQCPFREDAGLAAIGAWLDQYLPRP
jgi:enamine deaminase RidA (YjgF/YER057c/UK114 family)